MTLAIVMGLILGQLSPDQTVLLDRIVAVVNSDVITLSELEEAVDAQMRQADLGMSPEERLKKRQFAMSEGLELLISERLIEQEGAKRNLSVDEGDVDARISAMKSQQGWDDPTFQRYLLSQGLTLESLKATIRKQLLKQRVVGYVLGSKVQVSEADLRAYYREKIGELRENFELEAAHILLKVPQGATVADESAVRHRARELSARLRSGEDFYALAKKYSEGPAAVQGGRLGRVRKGFLEKSLETAFFRQEVGQPSAPVRSSFGYHLILVSARYPLPVPSYDELARQLNAELQRIRIDREMKSWVQTLRDKSFVEVRL